MSESLRLPMDVVDEFFEEIDEDELVEALTREIVETIQFAPGVNGAPKSIAAAGYKTARKWVGHCTNRQVAEAFRDAGFYLTADALQVYLQDRQIDRIYLDQTSFETASDVVAAVRSKEDLAV